MAQNVIKVVLPGYDALNDTNPDHFAIYADEKVDYVLIKEKTRNSQVVGSFTHVNIAHNLGYVPFILVFVDVGGGKYKKTYGYSVEGDKPYYLLTSSQLQLWNPTGVSVTFKYYIFYDKVT